MPAQDPRQMDPGDLEPLGKEMAALLYRERSCQQLNFLNLEELEALAKPLLPHMVNFPTFCLSLLLPYL